MTALEELDPLYHFSTHYRDRLNILDQCFPCKSAADKKTSSSRISRRKNNPRYKTQPITFDEIQEVEEPTTPSNENNNITPANSFLAKLHLQNANAAAEERLQPNPKNESSMSEGNTMRSSGSAENIWYDSPYPAKLSFLDVPETMAAYHHQHTKKVQSEKSNKLRNRALRRRNNPRYKTQPITFDEIQEVEEVEEPDANGGDQNEPPSSITTSPTIDVLINSSKVPGDPSQTLLVGYAR